MIILTIVGAILSIIVPFLIYRWLLKGEKRTITNKEYIIRFILSATLYMIPIIVIQVGFDHLLQINAAETTSVGQSLFVCFVRAAMLEEGVKFFFVYRLLRRHRDLGMKETILLAGVVGIGFGFLEKLVVGGGALIANAFFPGHMLFQWIMGYFIYKAFKSEGKEKGKYIALSCIVPVVIHGLWDFGLDVSTLLSESKNSIALIAGIALFVVMIAIYIVSFVKGMKTVKKIKE